MIGVTHHVTFLLFGILTMIVPTPCLSKCHVFCNIYCLTILRSPYFHSNQTDSTILLLFKELYIGRTLPFINNSHLTELVHFPFLNFFLCRFRGILRWIWSWQNISIETGQTVRMYRQVYLYTGGNVNYFWFKQGLRLQISKWTDVICRIYIL